MQMQAPVSGTASTPRPSFGAGRAALLLAIVAAGVLLLAAPPLHPAAPQAVVRLAGASLLAYAVFVLLAWFPMPWVSRRIEALFEDVVGEGQTGWYLAVALAHFALAELEDLAARWGSAPSVEAAVRESIAQQLVGFSVDSFMNALWASLWPMMVVREHGVAAAAVLAAFAWLAWRGGRLAFGETRLDALGRAKDQAAPD